jgi:hypothetical protein
VSDVMVGADPPLQSEAVVHSTEAVKSPVPSACCGGKFVSGQRKRIAERYSAGETMMHLAREYDCGVATIHRAIGG